MGGGNQMDIAALVAGLFHRFVFAGVRKEEKHTLALDI